MSEEAKQFIMGLTKSQGGGMYWYGKVPEEIRELFDFHSNSGWILNVYVEVKPRYQSFQEAWITEALEGRPFKEKV